MANPEHLEIVQKGVEAWNRWRLENPDVKPELGNTDFGGADLRGADFHRASLKCTNLRNANLMGANLQNGTLIGATLVGTTLNDALLIGADLREASLSHANLGFANLKKANLRSAGLTSATLSHAILNGADLKDATLIEAILSNADLRSANLSGANLLRANLVGACLAGANLCATDLMGANLGSTNVGCVDMSRANLGHTILADTDLSTVTGLDTVGHTGPSTIGIDTLYKSQGKISDKFLRDAGVPEDIIDIARLIRAGPPIQWHSCFISFATKDDEFAKRLHSRMREANMRVWFAPENLKGGKKLHEQLFEAIQIQDRLLLVLSEHSIRSQWVMTEIRKAREVEKKEKRRKLFPIRLVDFDMLRAWTCFDADTSRDLAADVREYFIPDFSN